MTNPFLNLRPGDYVTRLLGGKIPHRLRVTEVSDTKIFCGEWTFDMTTGAEIDPDLGWGPPPLHTGSFLKRE